jgi:catechol 2,3-dioxygenase-like lactoylglutathione lyase family enzyme
VAQAVQRFSPAKIAQVELHCTDLAAAKAFYCGMLGLAVVGEFGDSLFVRCGEVNLIIQASANPKLPGSMIYFSGDGCVPEATEALKAQGVVFREEPRCIARGHQGYDIWLGFFDDPWGNPLALLGNMPAAETAPAA